MASADCRVGRELDHAIAVISLSLPPLQPSYHRAFIAFVARDGKVLLKKNLGDPTGGGIVTYEIGIWYPNPRRCRYVG